MVRLSAEDVSSRGPAQGVGPTFAECKQGSTQGGGGVLRQVFAPSISPNLPYSVVSLVGFCVTLASLT